jgi:hypothetical protein
MLKQRRFYEHHLRNLLLRKRGGMIRIDINLKIRKKIKGGK